MARFLPSKTASEVVKRVWTVPVDADDDASSASLSATGITVSDNSLEGNDLVLTLTGGTAAATASVVATITTSRGRTLIDTLYIPIVDSAAQVADTARTYVDFALRKVTGLGETAGADEADHALQCLEGIIASWRAEGADIGSPYPLTLSSVIYCPDWAVKALRYNLLVECGSAFGLQPTAAEVTQAVRGLQLVKHKNLPDIRSDVYF